MPDLRVRPAASRARLTAVCRGAFGGLRRRRHCRLCGDVVCAPCTREVSLHRIPACAACHRAVDAAGAVLRVTPPDPLARQYALLAASRAQALHGLPRFNEYLGQLADELQPATRSMPRIEAIRHDAGAVKDTLQLIFDHFEAAARAIRGLKGSGDSQRDLVIDNIVRAAHQFVKEHRFSLRMLPGRLALYDQAAEAQPLRIPPGAEKPASLMASLGTMLLPAALLPPPDAPAARSVPLPANLGALMQRLEVLGEQRAQLEACMETAMQERRFGELPALQRAVDEVAQETDRVKLMCTQ